MRLIIDGYNLLRTLRDIKKKAVPGALENERKWLINWLTPLLNESPTPPEKVTLVFDGKGGMQSKGRNVSNTNELQVVFTTNEQADDWIEREISNEKHPRNLTVVSEDKRIVEFATKKGSRTLSCFDLEEFFTTQKRKVEAKEEKPQTSGPADEKMLEDLMKSQKARDSFKRLKEI